MQRLCKARSDAIPVKRCSGRNPQNLVLENYGKSVSPGIHILINVGTYKDNFISFIFIANTNDPDIADNVKKIKAKCEVERREAESQRLAGTEITNMLKQMMGLHQLGEGQHHGHA